MKRLICLISAFLTLCMFSGSGYAWWDLGHMVVANIAYQNLTPAVKNKVDKLVTHFKKEYPEVKTFEQMAVWLDTLHSKQQVYLYYHWHYVDRPLRTDSTRSKIFLPTDNIGWAIKKIKHSFANPDVNMYEQARLLAFLSHLVGDVHQPLHTVAQVNSKHPKGDKGGNLYFVFYRGTKLSLHQIWDSGFGLFEVNSSLNEAKQMAQRIISSYPPVYFGTKSKNLDSDEWIKEGMDNAIKYVYTTPEKQELNQAYQTVGRKCIEEEIALAGYRLATVLNQLLTV